MVGARVRYRPPLRVVDEIEGLAALGFRQVNIADDLFTANASHCLAICDEINRRDLKIRWSSFARVDTVSVPLLTRMREAGRSRWRRRKPRWPCVGMPAWKPMPPSF